MREDSYKPAGEDLEVYQLDWLIRRAEEGDGKALAALRTMLAKPEIWEPVWTQAKLARQMAIATLAKADPALAPRVKERLTALRKDLTGHSPSHLEKLLVARVAASWLNLVLAEVLNGESPGKERTDAQKLYYQRRANTAKKRHELAFKLLEVVGGKFAAAKKNKEAGSTGDESALIDDEVRHL